MKTMLVLMAASAVAAAQNPGPPPVVPGGPGGPVGDRSAQMLLARSAELDLTDAQVVKLAAIARKAEGRRRALRAQMDSGRARFTQPGDSVARRQFGERMRTSMDKERDFARTDLRDAIAVLTPDQQARAWEMAGTRARMARGGGGGRGMGMGRGMRGGARMGPGGGMPRARRGPPMGTDGFGPGMGRDRAAPDMPRRPGGMRPRMRPLDDGLPPVTTP